MSARFTLAEIVEATGGKVVRGKSEQQSCEGVSTDTRALLPGALFVALAGESFDAHDFLADALQAGAAALVVQREEAVPENVSIPVVLVADTRKALQDLARFHRLRFAIPVIAVTGSNGKTSTKDMVAAALGARFNVLKTKGNFNNEIGLPLTLLSLEACHEAAVVEMGMRGLGQIKELADIARPTQGIVTNVGETHLELLGSVANIAKAKAELVQALPSEGIAVLNQDDALVRSMAVHASCRVVSYGLSEKADVWAEDVHYSAQGIHYVCRYKDERQVMEIPAVGVHNVYNSLAAIAIAREVADLSLADIAAALRQYEPSGMRFEFEQTPRYLLVNDAYNASPLSMRAAIDTVAAIAQGRVVAVLGDMLELGDAAIEAHRAIGIHLVNSGIRHVVTVGPLAGYIAEAARLAGAEIALACNDHGEAQYALRSILRKGDTVLVKGSRGMHMEAILERLR